MTDEKKDYIAAIIPKKFGTSTLFALMYETSYTLFGGWEHDTEETLPAACRIIMTGAHVFPGNVYKWVRDGKLDRLQVSLMCHLADQLGHWVNYRGEAHIPECDKYRW